MTADRVIADDLYRALEEMLFLAVRNMTDSLRRDQNKLSFIDAVENLMEWQRKPGNA